MVQPQKKENTKYVTALSICKIFNKSQYPNMLSNNELAAEYIRSSHLQNPEKVGEPWCTHSQMIRYYNKNREWVVEVHQYLRKDGSIGASGLPEPKRLRIGNVIYIADTQGKRKISK